MYGEVASHDHSLLAPPKLDMEQIKANCNKQAYDRSGISFFKIIEKGLFYLLILVNYINNFQEDE